ncbi:amino acid/polyamine transporter I [Mycena maculata]|uniref:Amino acid/polyamine transporter I n=1 Tax=Mycena maculata TaxID=230809 RepID=A0AAD7IMP7_9AGAR|nr:amino acid/polyamine transporter I [Mycena maculata]
MIESSKLEQKTSGDVQSVSEKDNVYVLDVDNAKLAELGYKSEFKREFSLLETCAFSFSIMGIVASVSSTLAFGMAELASSMPTSAGLYYFSAKLAPEKYAPLASWITGWANITGQVALVCSIDFTCAQMITTAITVNSDGETTLSLGATYGILLAILFAHGVVCSAATRILARLNLFYVVVNVGTTVAAIIALLVVSGDNKVSTKDAFTLFENNSGWMNNGWAFMLAFTSPMWTLTGYDSAAHISEETAGAGRAAPIAIIVGVFATASFGWILLISTSFVIPSISDLLGTTLPLPMGQVFLDVFGKRGMLIIWSFIIVVQFVTGAAQGVDASRVVFAFARDNALPGSRWWKKMNSNAVPVHAVWFVMFWAGILGLLGFSVTALTSLAGASVIGLYTSYSAPIFLRITSGRNKMQPGPFSLGRWSTPVGVVAVSWVTFVTIMLLFPPGQTTTPGTMNYAVLIVGFIFMFATVSWVTSAHKWFHGPVRNVDDVEEKHVS